MDVISSWHKSSRSGTESNCVEVAATADGAAVRDSKHRDAGHVTVDSNQWHAFLTHLKTGAYDQNQI